MSFIFSIYRTNYLAQYEIRTGFIFETHVSYFKESSDDLLTEYQPH